MKKSEMLVKFAEKVEKINGVTVEYRNFSYWNNQECIVVDGAIIAWLVESYSVNNNSTGLRDISNGKTTKNLRLWFKDTLQEINEALKEKHEESQLIEKMLNI